MKTSTGLFVTAAAVATVGAMVVVALRKRAMTSELNEVPQIIDECFDRVQQLQRDLQKLRQATEPTG